MHDKIVVTTLDEAHGHVAIIYKQFQFETLFKEFEISRNEQLRFSDICKRHDFIDQEIINKSQNLK